LIIGASRGLGYALAGGFLGRGWRVTATARGTGRTALPDLAGPLVVEAVDIAVPEQVAALRDRLAQQKFRLAWPARRASAMIVGLWRRNSSTKGPRS
jgi:NAD(P)-dependent dehydrogenase (short-subunit alcohol dehydrogenase family)